ncbi:SDR family NAD(P)-dependent oxidoreductase [Spirillospora sp. CA-294931]|uniref:SDR family NAD(P)-dependent oxidoreductase n=1 Tax=Spirillospora sp. CA-294931 TaxID=3240042 RepID=UPI003D8EBFFC
MTSQPPPAAPALPRPAGRLVMTGASGTVGTALLAELAPAWPGRIVALGRTAPAPDLAIPGKVEFERVDLVDPRAVGAIAEKIVAGPAVGALVCAAGVDSRSGLADLFGPGEPNSHSAAAAARVCMQVNAWSHLHLLHAAVRSAERGSAPSGRHRPVLPVALISSDVVGAALPGTVAYAMSKAAAEEGFRHAATDVSSPGISLLVVRLPDIGVPMRAITPHTPEPRTGHERPGPVLAAAVNAIVAFVTQPRRPGLEEWHA